MQVREAKVKGGRGRGRAVEAADLPQNVHKDTPEALRDLARFLDGQAHMPDAALQLEDMVQDINRVLDDEILASMEDVWEAAIFQYIPENDDSFMLRKQKNYEMLKKLRDLQKTRLRDAISRAVSLKFS